MCHSIRIAGPVYLRLINEIVEGECVQTRFGTNRDVDMDKDIYGL